MNPSRPFRYVVLVICLGMSACNNEAPVCTGERAQQYVDEGKTELLNFLHTQEGNDLSDGAEKIRWGEARDIRSDQLEWVGATVLDEAPGGGFVLDFRYKRSPSWMFTVRYFANCQTRIHWSVNKDDL